MITRLKPGLGFLAGLAANLFAFKLALRREQGFHEFAFGAVVEAVAQAFQPRAEIGHGVAKLPMEHGIARQPFQIVKNDHMRQRNSWLSRPEPSIFCLVSDTLQ